MEKRRDLLVGIVFLAFSVGVYIASFGIKKLVISRIGSAFVPQLAAILLGGLSIALILQSALALRGAVKGESGQTAPGENKKSEPKKKNFSVAATFVLLLLYLSFLESVGFLITTTLYLFGQFIVLSRKKPNYLLYGTVALASSVIIYYLFVKVFVLFLPAGILG